MKIVVVLDGERHELEVDPARSVFRVDAREWPYHLVAADGASVTFEVLGERFDVQGDSGGMGMPEGSLVVNGELHTFRVESMAGSGARAPLESPALLGGKEHLTPSQEGPGRPVYPPMPGKVLEVRVRDGERVTAGQVLLVLEAMKMRNEVTAPAPGEIVGLRVTAGANVAARDLLLRIVPV